MEKADVSTSLPTLLPTPSLGPRNVEVAIETVVESEECKIQDIIVRLQIPEEVAKLAYDLWHNLSGSGIKIFQGNELAWFVCLLYIAILDTRLPYGPQDPQAEAGTLGRPCATVTDLLQAANITIKEFFQKMKMLKDELQLSEAVLQHRYRLQMKYLITCPLFATFEKIFDEVFIKEDNEFEHNGDVDDAMELEGFSQKKKYCWTLFVCSKGALLEGGQGVGPAFGLLLCCMDLALRSTHKFQLKPPFDTVRAALATENGESAGNVILSELCRRFSSGVTLTELQMLREHYLEPVLQSARNEQGTVECESLIQIYRDQYRVEGDIDELLLLQHDPHLYTEPTSRETNNNEGGVQERTQESSRVPGTPVRAALNTVAQLQNLLHNTDDEPSFSLQWYFKRCTMNPTRSIQTRIEQLNELFVNSYVEATGENSRALARQRFKLAIRLYYRVLGTLLKQEEQRLSQVDFSQLLNNTGFHKCLLACSTEVVLATYSTQVTSTYVQSPASVQYGPETAFPWVLKVCCIKAYDFAKVLENFVKAEPKLTPEIVRYLQNIERRIVEYFAWKEDSPLFESLRRYSSLPGSTTTSDVNNAQVFTSTLSPMRGTSSQIIAATQASPRQGSHWLNLFLNKVCKLGYQRLQRLCGLLNVPKELQERIWTCLEYCIMKRPELFKNRHLDQIMMCSMYAICKVTETEIKFKTIVARYRSLPHATQNTYKRVLISHGEQDTIINFYNRVFMQTLKNYILQFSSNKSFSPSTGSQVLAHSPSPVSPVYRLPQKSNFYISPMKASPFKVPVSPSQMTPRSRQLYSFGEGPGSSEKLKNINETLKSFAKPTLNQPQPRSRTRLEFDHVDGNGDRDKSEDLELIPVKKMRHSPSRRCLNFSKSSNLPSK